ncbi:MAG: hypothetical protein LBN02_09970 [Oscillospiraceae bacterium]|jgi:hypothetical protein|nr:hypothetical protein [Oscillospiraceae bacterium]
MNDRADNRFDDDLDERQAYYYEFLRTFFGGNDEGEIIFTMAGSGSAALNRMDIACSADHFGVGAATVNILKDGRVIKALKVTVSDNGWIQHDCESLGLTAGDYGLALITVDGDGTAMLAAAGSLTIIAGDDLSQVLRVDGTVA